MTNTVRIISATAMGLMAGVAIGAGPALAAGNGAQSDVKAGAQQHIGRDDVVGYFRSLSTCDIAGHIGELQGRWDDYGCDPVRVGFSRGGWVLTVERDRGWMDHSHQSDDKPKDDGYGAPKNDTAADGY
ncbi:hypothetical protein [Paractinoplanes hotanensis]|uniref:Uncharacterized protein n=1 Tax=Paractinoplanes hotanensis TaxID=2906497 RepID=A0ABT0Y5D4_9ACTN|nr:hypothetical protein [Actinoplanes hotanensis]MCM4081232.1 hypothetical protein [Actinoplanes hotanensis]